ncbi:type VI secretion system-associated protein VasI [Scandinavium goeteborgense]|uniref:type VI secretion system-associated protein VasI n=1 Tax=Scandinavium goeteborgense TaxID=1851514 RepID=UPI00382E2D27
MSTWLLITALIAHVGQWLPTAEQGVSLDPEREMTVTQKLAKVTRCREETSPLVRLECYDQALSTATEIAINQTRSGPAWQKAMEQEKGRTRHSTAFLVTQGAGNNPTVVITTPAIGIPPPRPVLMFSCIDNITRLQIAITTQPKDGSVRIAADNDHFAAQWFLRENGYLLESSRGLAGIDEIKRLMPAKTLTIDSVEGGFPRLTFNIEQLSEVVKPLRNACHW